MDYALVEKNTNLIRNIFGWANKEIDSNYPLPDDCYIIKIDESIMPYIYQRGMEIYAWKLKDQNATTYEDMFEEILKPLEILKKEKINELNNNCKETILGTFEHDVNGVVYYFSCDTEAQSDFEKFDRAFEKGRITEIMWTAYDINGIVTRLVFDQTSFESLYVDHLNHIQNNISKFRDTLEPKVNSCTIEDEINQIIW